MPKCLRRWWPPLLRLVGLVTIAVLVALYHWWPQIEMLPYTAELDGRYVMHQLEVGKAAILQYHELALFNPYDCRGIPMWDHPEAITASPILLLATKLDAASTLALWNIVHCTLGFLGMWWLSRRELAVGPMAAFVAASMWALGASHTSQYAGAHSTLICFWLAPLMLGLWRGAEKDLRMGVALGAVVAFMLYEGATYPLPFCTLVVGLDTLTRLYPVRRLPRVALAGLVTGATAIGLSAARLLPLLAQMAGKKRPALWPDVDDLSSLFALKKMFLWREAVWSSRIPDQQYVWGEYIAYLGPVVLTLTLVGAALAVRRHRWFLALGILTLLLMMGHFAKWAPWSYLQHHVFPFKAMRVPSRFRLVLHLFLSGFLAIAVEDLGTVLSPLFRRQHRLLEGVRVAVLGGALLGIGDAAGLGHQIIKAMHQGPPLKTVERGPRLHYEGAGMADFLDQPRQNQAWLGCRSYEWPSHQRAPLWIGDVPSVRAADPAQVRVLGTLRTVNTFRFDVEVLQPGRVLLNSGHADGFRTNVGTVVEDPSELLAVDLPVGKHKVLVRYWPKRMSLGIGISCATLVLVLVGLGIDPWLRRRRRATRGVS